MISLPAIEEPFTCRYPPTDNGPQVAVEGIEMDEGRRIVLFTTETLTLRQANEILQEAGMRGIFRLDGAGSARRMARAEVGRGEDLAMG